MPSITDQITSHNSQSEPPLSAKERAARFEQVYRDAASMEAARRAAGLPDAPAPWPRVHLEVLSGADAPCPNPAVA